MEIHLRSERSTHVAQKEGQLAVANYSKFLAPYKREEHNPAERIADYEDEDTELAFLQAHFNIARTLHVRIGISLSASIVASRLTSDVYYTYFLMQKLEACTPREAQAAERSALDYCRNY